jgi:hypothetical protein
VINTANPKPAWAAHLNAVRTLLCLESFNRGSEVKRCDYFMDPERAE